MAGPFDLGTDDIAEVSILPGWRTQSGTHMAALRVKLAPGWKTYWRSPGDAGVPPQFNWSGSENLAAVSFHWPRPNVYTINGLRSIGYYDELILPIEVTPMRPSDPIRLKADIDLGVCEEICVPMSFKVSADLGRSSTRDQMIVSALRARPQTKQEARVRDVNCALKPIEGGLELTARINMPSLGSNEVMVFELPDQTIWISGSTARREGRDLVATSDLISPSGAPFALDRSDLRITVLGDNRAVELRGCSAG